jgi:hypothetical protein
MSKRWTVFDPGSKNIVDVDGFNDEYNTQKGALNGGVDRNNLPGEYITRAQIKQGAFHKTHLFTGLLLSDESIKLNNGGNLQPDGLDYSLYNGGWRRAFDPVQVSGLRDGMNHIEFNCWQWQYRFTSGFSLEPGGVLATQENHDHWVKWRILYNGMIVLETGAMYTQYDNVTLSADFPMMGGDASIEVQFAFAPPAYNDGDPVDVVDSPMFTFAGGQILLLSRFR